ncbi:MFS transporter [Beijerinckia sp. L45]|uniref:MFS transporter n=1 Tax=Beijerinckia sp. L45 TaxID=1641855 RepID=UPI001FEFC061|nr:MFS transporter [Beijerinckia sp. L45]
MSAEFNELVMQTALVDVRGALGIGHDAGIWIDSLYESGLAIGMAFAPWSAMTFTLRRFALFAIGLACVTTLLIPFMPNIDALLTLRFIQGLSGGFTIPLLMTTALRVLPPPIRLYGLAVYALTATFSPAISASIAAFWVDVVDWRFVFFEALPLDAIAAALVLYGMPHDAPLYDRLRQFDWRGALLLMASFGCLTTLLIHGDHEDWFNSEKICLLALVSVVAFPLLAVSEWFHPLPLLKLQMLGRRNFAYGVIGLFLFLVISLSSSSVPQDYLVDVRGYRAFQAHWITLLIALGQFIMLPFVAFLLDHRWADPRAVTLCGLALVMAACLGSAGIDASWNRDQFYLWQTLQMIGQPMIVVSLLMIATNAVRGPTEGPFASALVNATRSLAAPAGTCIVELVQRWRGALHSSRLVDQVGQNRFVSIQAQGLVSRNPSPLLADGQQRAVGSLEQFARAVETQASVLTTADIFIVMAALCAAMGMLVMLLSARTFPPRILFAKH